MKLCLNFALIASYLIENFCFARFNNNKEISSAKEKEWQISREKTDSLLKKVHMEMQKLGSDLEKTSEQQANDLEILKKTRADENSKLEKTEARLQKMAAEAIEPQNGHSNLNPESLLEENHELDANDESFLAPLRNAAKEAKSFAEQVRKQGQEFQGMTSMKDSGKSSLLQTDGDYGNELSLLSGEKLNSDKAQESLKLAQEALSKLTTDVANQKRELHQEKIEESTPGESFLDGVGRNDIDERSTDISSSFLQMRGSKNKQESLKTANDASFGEWKKAFEKKLEDARKQSGLSTPASFVELGSKTGSDEKFSSFTESESDKNEQRHLKQLQDEFESQMRKLHAESSNMIAEAKADEEKTKESAAKFEAGRSSESFLQDRVKNPFDPEKERESIRQMEKKWEREAQKLSEPSAETVAESNEIASMIETRKEKEQAAEAELERMQEKTKQDIETLHKDIATNSVRDELTHNDLGSSFLQLEERKKDVDGLQSRSQAVALLHKLEALLNSDMAKSQAQAAAVEEKVKEMNNGGSEDPVSFAQVKKHLQENSHDEAESALAKAQADLLKLQKELKVSKDELPLEYSS